MRGAPKLRDSARRQIGVVGATLLAVATLQVAMPAGRSGSAATGLLHPGSMVTARVVVQVDMSSWTSGLGVALLPPTGTNHGHEYLVATTDGGVRWTVRATYVQAVGNWLDAPTLLVAPDGDLYAVDTIDSRLELSTDTGVSWRPLRLEGRFLESAKLVGDQLWATTSRCRGSDSIATCTSQLAVYRIGEVAPLTVHAIPGSTQPVASGVAIFGVVGRQGAVVVEGFSQDYWPQVHFVTTSDGGASWRSAVDPCARPLPGEYQYQVPQPTGLGISPSGRWTLYCTVHFLGLGGGYNALYTSTTAGRSWQLLARSALPGVRPVGRLDDVSATTFGISNDGRYLWKVSTWPPVSPASESADGGRLWTAVRRPTSGTSRGVDSVGPRGAFFASIAQGLWRTEDGVHWTLLR